jgi:hypothetical protein
MEQLLRRSVSAVAGRWGGNVQRGSKAIELLLGSTLSAAADYRT